MNRNNKHRQTMKTVFDKPNEQCQARLDIAVARKRGLKAKLFLLGAMVCALGMMTACKCVTANENANDSNLLLGEWQCVESAIMWNYDEEGEEYAVESDYQPYHFVVDTGLATLVAFNFIDTDKCIVTYHTHDCSSKPPYLTNIDTAEYSMKDIYISIGWYSHNTPRDFEIEKLTRDTLVLRCFEQEEGAHSQMRYTFVRK